MSRGIFLENAPKAHQNGGFVARFDLFLSTKIAVILLGNVLKNLSISWQEEFFFFNKIFSLNCMKSCSLAFRLQSLLFKRCPVLSIGSYLTRETCTMMKWSPGDIFHLLHNNLMKHGAPL